MFTSSLCLYNVVRHTPDVLTCAICVCTQQKPHKGNFELKVFFFWFEIDILYEAVGICVNVLVMCRVGLIETNA